jgi:hypothetical protein
MIPFVLASTSQQPRGRDDTLSLLTADIEALNHAKEASSITLAKGVFGTVRVLLNHLLSTFEEESLCLRVRNREK